MAGVRRDYFAVIASVTKQPIFRAVGKDMEKDIEPDKSEDGLLRSARNDERGACLDALADAEIEAGYGVSHEIVREWLGELAKGKKVPPPGLL